MIKHKLMRKAALLLLLLILALSAISVFLFLRSKSKYKDIIFINHNYSLLATYKTKEGKIEPLKDSFTHVTVQWFSNYEYPEAPLLDSLISAQKPLFIHLEIYGRDRFLQRDLPVAEDISTGNFDEKLEALAEKFNQSGQPLLISYNHDIEVPSANYPWQLQDAKAYQASFERVHKVLKTAAASIKMVWAAAGYPGCEEYHPGDKITDYNTASISNLPDAKDGPYDTPVSVQEQLRRKLFRLRFFSGPVLIVGKDSLYNKALPAALIDSLNANIQQNKDLFYFPQTPFNYDSVNARTNTGLPVFGVFDYADALVTEPGVKAEHIFIDLQNVKNDEFKQSIQKIAKRRHSIILTMEPWKDGVLEKDPQLLQNIIDGNYDNYFKSVFTELGAYAYDVYFRWGHEMEIPVDRYPWQQQDPVTYIKAFRHVRQMQKAIAPNAKMVWGPAGDRGSVEWYPGDDAVDFVSIAIYGLPDKNISDHKLQQSFSNIFDLKLHRMRFARRPLFITEFGVKGPQNYKQDWLTDAAKTIRKNPVVKGVCYFNFTDVPGVWGTIETPDWSISKETCEHFIKALYN